MFVQKIYYTQKWSGKYSVPYVCLIVFTETCILLLDLKDETKFEPAILFKGKVLYPSSHELYEKQVLAYFKSMDIEPSVLMPSVFERLCPALQMVLDRIEIHGNEITLRDPQKNKEEQDKFFKALKERTEKKEASENKETDDDIPF